MVLEEVRGILAEAGMSLFQPLRVLQDVEE